MHQRHQASGIRHRETASNATTGKLFHTVCSRPVAFFFGCRHRRCFTIKLYLVTCFSLHIPTIWFQQKKNFPFALSFCTNIEVKLERGEKNCWNSLSPFALSWTLSWATHRKKAHSGMEHWMELLGGTWETTGLSRESDPKVLRFHLSSASPPSLFAWGNSFS